MDRGGWRATVHGVLQSQNLENSSAPFLLHTHLLAQAAATFPGGGQESPNWSHCFTSISIYEALAMGQALFFTLGLQQ